MRSCEVPPCHGITVTQSTSSLSTGHAGGETGSRLERRPILSTELVVAANFCSSCGHRLNPGDRFCAQCGQSTNAITKQEDVPVPAANSEASQSGSISISPEIQAILGNRWVVIGILAATGPIGLPALWFSPRFRPWVKITISILYFFVTAIFPLLVAWYWFGYALQPLVDIFGK